MKDIKGFEGLYAVTRTGAIFSHRKGSYLRLNRKKNGYVYVELNNGGKATHHRVHRLVAEAFVPNPAAKPFVNHKNGVKSDNRAANLEWVTGGENNRHAIRTGLVNRRESWDVWQHGVFVGTFVGQMAIAATFGIAKNTVNNAVREQRPTRGGLRIRRAKEAQAA